MTSSQPLVKQPWCPYGPVLPLSPFVYLCLWMRAGGLESISHDDVASMLGLAATKPKGKKLELVVLNGCETEDLGKVRHIAHQNQNTCIRHEADPPPPVRVLRPSATQASRQSSAGAL